MEASRLPKTPTETARTRSPGLSTLMTAASSPPVPEAVSVITSLETPKTQFSPSVTRLMMSANAGPR